MSEKQANARGKRIGISNALFSHPGKTLEETKK